MAQDAPKAKPGWYPDPDNTGGQRFWDGSSWTEKSDLRAERTEQERRANRRLLIITLAIFLVTGLGLGGWLAYSWNGTPGGAKDACHGYVKDRLKAPTTAEFAEEQVSGPRDKVYVVTGYVDSQNGFGAMVRNSYECRARFSGGGDYIYDGLDLSHN